MNLTIDIGNTNAMICIFKNNKIIKYKKVNVINFSKKDQYIFFKKLFLKYLLSQRSQKAFLKYLKN